MFPARCLSCIPALPSPPQHPGPQHASFAPCDQFSAPARGVRWLTGPTPSSKQAQQGALQCGAVRCGPRAQQAAGKQACRYQASPALAPPRRHFETLKRKRDFKRDLFVGRHNQRCRRNTSARAFAMVGEEGALPRCLRGRGGWRHMHCKRPLEGQWECRCRPSARDITARAGQATGCWECTRPSQHTQDWGVGGGGGRGGEKSRGGAR